MEAAEQEMKRLGDDEDDGELKLEAGQGEVEEVSGAGGTPDAGRVQRRIHVAEISGDVSRPLLPAIPTRYPIVHGLSTGNDEDKQGFALCFLSFQTIWILVVSC
ncbi:hypothetical protein C2S51_033694 [Perilla frutescens var. frutescens]|nr:hypothetical protein C2S51_033694 [Perilla frutescens var. frutescens]